MMDNVFEAAVAYTNAELNNYTRLDDFHRTTYTTSSAVDTISNRLNCIESEFRDFSLSVTDALGTTNIYGSVSEIEQLKDEVRLIKEVLIDVQMMLRTLELDDMSRRMGDLDMLLL